MINLSYFDRYTLDTKTHIYRNTKNLKNKYISVTEFINQLKAPFNAEGAAIGMKKYKNDPRSIAEIIESFELSRRKGTYIHNFIESTINNDEKLYHLYRGTQKIFNNFWENILVNDILEPVKNEFIVGDEDLLMCGTIDQLFFNKNTNKYELWDWKTNNKFTIFSNYKFKKPISFLEASHFNTYSIQLLLYKKLIEKNSSIKIDACKIFHINSEQYTIHKVVMDEAIIDLLLKDYDEKR